MTKIGPKEQEVRALRERRAAGRKGTNVAAAALGRFLTESSANYRSHIEQEPPIPAAPQQETTMKKAKAPKAKKAKAKRAKGLHPVIKSVSSTGHKTSRVTTTGRVPASDVGDFICRDGGATMTQLVENFGIEAHPMRAKIHRAKHELGYKIRHDGEKYAGTAPKAAC